MTRGESEAALAAAGGVPDAHFPFFEAGLACALHDNPGRDPEPARALVAEAAERLQARLRSSPADEAMCEVLGVEMRFGGDHLTPEDPGNGDLITVCARRCGLPAALGVLFLEAGRRCELKIAGVDFPGHFLLRVETAEGPVALDPVTGGQIVMPSDLIKRALRAGLPVAAADDLDHLMRPVTDRAVLLRLQAELFARATHAADFPRAEGAALRRALLDPADHRPWLDVAAAREGQGRLAGSLEALARAQSLDGMASVAARAQRERVRMRLN